MTKNHISFYQKIMSSLVISSAGLSLALSSLSLVHADDSVAHQLENNVEEQQALIHFSNAEVEQILAPIALYPDTLLTHILIAATYPIEVIEAERFLALNKNTSSDDIALQVEKKSWDPSVQALIAFPQILEKLSEDLNWMRKLGDVFLNNEQQVLSSIQTLRAKADEAGNLSQMDNVAIVREKQTIIIEPSQPDVIYVPYYDTRMVYGQWHWSHYPPVYWHRPIRYAYAHGPFYWHDSVHISVDFGLNFFFSAFHWKNHHIVRHHHKQRYYRSNKRISRSHYAKKWHHNPKHRRGVSYCSPKVKKRYATVNQGQPSYKVTRHKNVKNMDNHRHHRNGNPTKHHRISKKLQAKKAVQTKEHFTTAPGRLAAPQSKKHKINQTTQKRFYKDTWKKQPRIVSKNDNNLASPLNKKYVPKESSTQRAKQARIIDKNQDYKRNTSRVKHVNTKKYNSKKAEVKETRHKKHKTKRNYSNHNRVKVANRSRHAKSEHSSRSRSKER